MLRLGGRGHHGANVSFPVILRFCFAQFEDECATGAFVPSAARIAAGIQRDASGGPGRHRRCRAKIPPRWGRSADACG